MGGKERGTIHPSMLLCFVLLLLPERERVERESERVTYICEDGDLIGGTSGKDCKI